MAPQTTISKWGNSSGIRIPTSIVRNMNLELGDKLEFIIDDDQTITLKVIKKHENIFSSIEAKNYDFQADLKNDVYAMELAPVGREIIK
ncbi:AbrB/MazE/SpoVT family DNA-binding domain-containing protein [uncultured Enterococcus sp.]|uniref:AbrB/MazE/SpoVT family DNA-binding domain-containing protein n=1 Tax=uncultured Enterococcus sp. TaxID=167972 RepID=UPI002609BA0C|nr:AbrB/MazE/SpoVT family DNA-binding domain-containing protein [uncultured Enterococcus sp.]